MKKICPFVNEYRKKTPYQYWDQTNNKYSILLLFIAFYFFKRFYPNPHQVLTVLICKVIYSLPLEGYFLFGIPQS